MKVQGTILQENDKTVRSERNEMEGVARRVRSNNMPEESLLTNVSVPFYLGDPRGRKIRVHTAEELDSVMQLVSVVQECHETILSVDTRVWLRG